jgi:hypothetical protein
MSAPTDAPEADDDGVLTIFYWFDDEPADEDELWASAMSTTGRGRRKSQSLFEKRFGFCVSRVRSTRPMRVGSSETSTRRSHPSGGRLILSIPYVEVLMSTPASRSSRPTFSLGAATAENFFCSRPRRRAGRPDERPVSLMTVERRTTFE